MNELIVGNSALRAGGGGSRSPDFNSLVQLSFRAKRKNVSGSVIQGSLEMS